VKRKGRAKEDDEESPAVRGEIPGLVLLCILVVTFVALISEQVQGSGNLLGPWLGSRWANFLNSAFGKLPVLFHLAGLTLVGVQLVFKIRLWKQAAIAGGIGLLLELLLSIRHLGLEGLLYADYQVSGGWIGNFLAQRLFQPVFGAGHFGPYLLTSLLIFVLVVWAFQISV